MLAEIGDVVREANLVKSFKKSKGYWRVRTHASDKKFTKDSDLSPPPQAFAVQANRMSPAGISMFYGADEFETACYETVDPKSAHTHITGGKFIPLPTLQILDLVRLPPIPSFFEKGSENLRDSLGFLYGFVHDLAKPIKRGEHHHIEYVPTQAFTEYVRFEMKTRSKRPIDGIRYPSSKNKTPCVVLFCGQDECVDKPTRYGAVRWMELDPKSLRTVEVDFPPVLKPNQKGK